MQRFFKVIGINLAVLLALMLCVEIVLRALGYRAGDISPYWSNFRAVDSLIVYKHYYVNEDGLQVADPRGNKNVSVNQDGFRSPEWVNLDTSQPRLMLIGDSFVWGLSATPLDSSFADLLRKLLPRWHVINLGIPVTDPAQYLGLAKKYIPLLRPDVVIVGLYLGNDLMEAPRELIPHRAVCYSTNAGVLMASDGDRYFASADAAYDYYLNEKYKLLPANTWEHVMAASALLSRVYALKFRWQERQKFKRLAQHNTTTAAYLRQIQEVCNQYGAYYRILVIPRLQECDFDADELKASYPAVFSDSVPHDRWIFINNLNTRHYEPLPDGHFNNDGHRKAADALLRAIKQYEQSNGNATK
ncbi:MAG: hypothetical protein NZM35_04220 [Chitinophagales bacterium]|nr:hypothetical protein [Chitinophagales bacterium]MDW8418407.1 hypothetical protein [Chitinophagales bacterium]